LYSEEEGLLYHGGRLCENAARYGIAVSEWLDLSTGINPHGWPVPPVPAAVWARLPDEDGLEKIAATYYSTEYLLPTAGSQAAIQLLPLLRTRCRVGVLAPGYAEHFRAWQAGGHEVATVAADDLDAQIEQFDVLVLSNPNNPTGRCFPRKQLLAWYGWLAVRGGWLIVDEAFIDVTSGESLAPYSNRPGLIVLCSLGKFFGLAGVRAGFVCAAPELLSRMKYRFGPWAVSGPARWVAAAALQDRPWQIAMRRRLVAQGDRLRSLLTRHGLRPNGGCALFQWCLTPHARQLEKRLAAEGILIRRFEYPPSVRFGLPGREANWRRLDVVLGGLRL